MMNEPKRLQLNHERLQWLHPTIKPKVHAVLTDLQGHGLRPVLASSTFRTPAEQRRLKAQGRSKVSWSFHCARMNGRPAALAADIVEADMGWGAPRKFWLMLGSSATAHGMQWGGFWGLRLWQRRRVRRLWKHGAWNSSVALGWDPAHIQTAKFSLRKARRLFG